MSAKRSIRAELKGSLEPSLVEGARARARELGLLGWVRLDGDGALRVHAEGERVDELADWLRAAPGAGSLEVKPGKVEGHEQFAIRGVPAGDFTVVEVGDGFELRLEVAGGVRAWALPKGPSMNPKDKRFAIELAGPGGDGPVVDQGAYEQGGRVPWPEALERGHAVFVLHGERLRGGFALQRTRGTQWLLVKRRDGYAAP
jgi:acylphosphatase